jgi:hypothetical protein
MTTFTLYCVVEGESTSFPVEISADKSIGQLKDAIKLKSANEFRDVDAKQLTLWKVSIPATDDEEIISLDNVSSGDKKKLGPARASLSSVFPQEPGDNDYIIVQRPQSGNATHCSMQAFSTRLMESRHQSKSQL